VTSPSITRLALGALLYVGIPAGAAAPPPPTPPAGIPVSTPRAKTTATPAPGKPAPSVPLPPWASLPTRTFASLKTHVLGDPVNIAFEGTRQSILAAFARIGWRQADPLSVHNDVRLAVDAAAHRLYPTAPVSNLYLFGHKEDFAVEFELGSVARRDHARFWDTMRRDPRTGLELYVGDASQDVAVKVLRNKRGVPVGTTHRINANLDAERDGIVRLVRGAGLVAAVVTEQGMGRTSTAVNGGGDRFYTDGQASVVVLNVKGT